MITKGGKILNYVIDSGRFETGNEEQQQAYMMLFGKEDIQYFFDLYFHWYNLIHEIGHCLVEKQGACFTKAEEEMYVNSLAVSYYRHIGEDQRLSELKKRLDEILNRIPAPMPEGEDLVSFYNRIWNTEQINNVMIYGYFQLRSVLEALNGDTTLAAVLKNIGIDMKTSNDLIKERKDITSENAEYFLKEAIHNLRSLGADIPEIRIDLLNNPMIQRARED